MLGTLQNTVSFIYPVNIQIFFLLDFSTESEVESKIEDDGISKDLSDAKKSVRTGTYTFKDEDGKSMSVQWTAEKSNMKINLGKNVLFSHFF